MIQKFLQFIALSSLILFGFFLQPQHVEAQKFELYSADDVFLEIIPEIPKPNTLVRLKLKSYSFNLNNYYIAWFENGNRKSAGYGSREFSFKTGQSGDITNITAVIEYEGKVFRKELRFSPSTVDLLWEASDSYTPPFYKGKALPIEQAEIRVTAIPETLLIEPNDAPNLIYYWDRNYKRQIPYSGFGRQSFNFTIGPIAVSEKITVTSNDRRENSVAKNTIDIPFKTYKSKILFYEINDSGRLMTNKALNTHNQINGDTIKFSFQPLHMSSVKENFTDLFVNWSVNNKRQPPQDFAKQNELYVTSNGESGVMKINVGLEGIQKLLQKSSGNFELIFNTNN